MSTMAEEFAAVVEGAQVGFEDQQRFFHKAQSALAGGRAEGASLGHEGPADGVVGILHHPLVLKAPDEFGEAGFVTVCRFFEILLVIGQPCFPLWLSGPQVGLVRRLPPRWCYWGIHLHSGLVDHLLLNAVAIQRALVCFPLFLRAATVAPSPLWLDGVKAPEHPGVVGAHDPSKVWHGGVANLDSPAVEDLM